MRRILLMVIRNILFVPYWFIKVCIWGKSDKHTEEEKFRLLKHYTIIANKSGRVTINSFGLDNIPKQDGFIMFPNHQGLFDALSFFESCPRPFTVVVKKEVYNFPFLKRIFRLMKVIPINREDVRQSMKVISQVAEEVKAGRNYIIFSEGTRSKEKNKVGTFKGGSFKSAYYAKCPIVPVAIIDAYKPFDTKSLEKVNVQIHYMEPIGYEEYKNLKTVEIAEIVKRKIQEKIYEFDLDKNY